MGQQYTYKTAFTSTVQKKINAELCYFISILKNKPFKSVTDTIFNQRCKLYIKETGQSTNKTSDLLKRLRYDQFSYKLLVKK